MLDIIYSQGTVQEQAWFQQEWFLILWVLCSCPVWVPFTRRTEGLFEEDVNVGLVHGGASRALLTLSLQAPRFSRRGFDLIRFLWWHYLHNICREQCACSPSQTQQKTKFTKVLWTTMELTGIPWNP